MQFPFDLSEVRMISIDGNTVRLDLPNGHFEVTFDSREVMERLLKREEKAIGGRHVLYESGIYGL
jgi:hypothetical protein